MAELARESAKTEPPPEIESRLLAEFDRTKRHKRITSWTLRAGAVAALVTAGIVALPRAEYAPEPAAPEASQESEQPFVLIPYVAPLTPYERADVVRMNLPVAALIAAGLPVDTADTGARVEADVLVGQDGRARAVRLVSISTLN